MFNRQIGSPFGLFEVDAQAGELWKAGYKVRLAGQPFTVLMTLLARPGEVVTREELQLQVWGTNTTVDFERALAGAINKVREALGDSADNPRFIQTLPKRGYRFIAPVTPAGPPSKSVASGHAFRPDVPEPVPAMHEPASRVVSRPADAEEPRREACSARPISLRMRRLCTGGEVEARSGWFVPTAGLAAIVLRGRLACLGVVAQAA